MKIAHYQRSLGTVLGMAISQSESAGEVEAGVCRRCGYTEFYTKDPGNIIADGVYVRELSPGAP